MIDDNVTDNTPSSGQIVLSSTPQALPNLTCVRGVWIVGNTGAVGFIGGSNVTTTSGFPIPIGTPVLLPVNHLSSVYVVGSGTISFFAV